MQKVKKTLQTSIDASSETGSLYGLIIKMAEFKFMVVGYGTRGVYAADDKKSKEDPQF